MFNVIFNSSIIFNRRMQQTDENQTSRHLKRSAKSVRAFLNTRVISGETRLSGFCYLWGFGNFLPAFKQCAIVENRTLPPPGSSPTKYALVT